MTKARMTPKKLAAMNKKLVNARVLIIDIITECEKYNPEFSNWGEEGFRSNMSGALVYLNDSLGIYEDKGKLFMRGISIEDVMERDEEE